MSIPTKRFQQSLRDSGCFELQVHSRRSALDVHEYEGTFHGRSAHFRMTSVIGHVLSIDFPAKFQNWDTTDPSTLFDAPTMKNESNPKVMPDPSTRPNQYSCSESEQGAMFAGTHLSPPAIRSQGV